MQQTNWHVITGAPCSGKTAVIGRLEQMGVAVVHEVARALIDAELEKGRTIEQIKANESAFEESILTRKIKIESSLDTAAVIFLDRAIPDSIAYYRFLSLDAAEPEEKSRLFRYKNIFLFDRFDFKNDPVRSEDDGTAQRLEMLLEGGYRKLGYDPVRVPKLSVEARTDFVLQHLE